MGKVRLTKNELKRQKEDLIRFYKYLPMLQLKKQQLQAEIGRISRRIEDLSEDIEELRKKTDEWIDVFAEDVEMNRYFTAGRIVLKGGNVAGIDIPVYQDVEFVENPYDLYIMPLWVDKGVEVLKEAVRLRSQIEVLIKQKNILQEELRIVTQRVNLFEKVKIPEAKENIRLIRIFLGDLFTVEVVRGKIAKAKLQRKNQNSYVYNNGEAL